MKPAAPSRLSSTLACAFALLLALASGDPALFAPAQAATPSALAVRIPAAVDPLLQGLAIPADAPTAGMWSATQPWPMNAVHLVMLPDGRVMSYGTPANDPGTQDARTRDFWNPALGFGAGSHDTSFDAARYNSFCSTAAWLADGRLMVTGGNVPTGSTMFNAFTGAGTAGGSPLADQRWYSTMLALPDGRALMLGGMDPYSEGMENAPDAAVANGQVSMTPEIYTPGTGWRNLSGATSRLAFGPEYLRTSYPRAWVLPSGRVFGLSTDQMWYLDPNANGGAGALQIAGTFKGPPSATAPVNVGATNSAVMYAPGKVLVVGGNGGFNGDGRPASNQASVIDVTGAAPVVTETQPMRFARRFVNTIVLPDGRVAATGGTRVGNNGGADAVFEAELWNPATGQWTTGARAAQIRTYHSTALLMPNGTVLSAGGGAPGPVNNLNAEVYYPPYLFRTVNGVAQLATRPVLTGISALAFATGAPLRLELADSTAIAQLVLVANGTVTHAFNNSQRRVPLAFTQSGSLLSATLPANANLLPPGYYQLYAVDAAGVPSRAVVVSVGLSTRPPAPVLPRDVPVALESGATPGQVVSTDAASLAITIAATDPTRAPATAQYTVRNGLADAACVSFESVAKPGQWLRHAGYRLQLAANDATALFQNDATFCPEAGLAGSGVSLRAKNYPGHLLQVRSGQVWLDPQAATAAYAAGASFQVRTIASSAPAIGPQAVAPALAGSAVAFAPGLSGTGLSYSWLFGDGSPATAYAASSAASHVYAQPGVYAVTLVQRAADGSTSSRTFFQPVYRAPTAQAPRASSQMALEPRSGASARLWVANADNGTVAVIDTATNQRVAEVATGSLPRSVARAPDGGLWVVNGGGDTVAVVNPVTLAVSRLVGLPRAGQPHGMVISADGKAYVALQALGRVLKIDTASGQVLAAVDVGPAPRHLALSADGARLLVSRFISPPLPGEATATVQTTLAGAPRGGEVLAVATASMTLQATVVLRHSDATDTEISGAGLPNYLGPALVSPDGTLAWVPSKQDNILRGVLRNGLGLNFQNTVRAVSSRIDLATLAETPAARIDHDNAGLAVAGAYSPTGNYLFVALETARQVAVVDAYGGHELFRIEAGLAPQSVAVSADGTRLYVHNALSRSVGVVDLSPLARNGELRSAALATVATVGSERLAANVLRGKQLFHDARDTRLARDGYLSCATCHADGGHDGRTWDLTGFGEGLRNTIALRGRAGGQGKLHWSGNFDEVQDFEGQIRNLAGGTGLMTDAQFAAGTRSQPLGDRKTGVSADLDALAAYLQSLGTPDASPWRNADGSATAAAVAGKAVFSARCASCHGGRDFSDSAAGVAHDIGTLKPASGKRLGGTLSGLDTPTLRDVALTAPYLHDGSAATIEAAIGAHAGLALAAADLANVAAYVRQIGREEPGIVGVAVGNPVSLVAAHSGKCLDVAGASRAAGAAVVQQTCVTGSASQRWQKLVADDGYRWRNVNAGLCLAVEGASLANAARLVQAACDNAAPSQVFPWNGKALPVRHSGQCADISGASTANGAQAIQWPCHGGTNQQFGER